MADIHMTFSPRIMTGSLSRIGSGVGNWGSHALLLADTALEDAAADIQDQLDSRGVRTIQFSREGLGCDILTLDDALSLARVPTPEGWWPWEERESCLWDAWWHRRPTAG
jgi:hypothetical protein